MAPPTACDEAELQKITVVVWRPQVQV